MTAPIGSDLSGKVAFVTGGGTGIGRAVAARFAARGVHVVVAGRRLEPLEEVAAATGAVALQCDVSDSAAVDAAIATTVDRFGGLDIVVNNAAIALRGGVEQASDDDWSRTFDINLKGPASVSRAAVPHLRQRGGGAIVNVASIAAFFAAGNSATYGTTKAAVLGLTRSMANDLGRDGIRVNSLCPGWVETDMAAGAADTVAEIHGVSQAEARTLMVGRNPIQRLADPDEIAACVEFLSCDASAFVTGSVLMADGGQAIVDLGMLAMNPLLQ